MTASPSAPHALALLDRLIGDIKAAETDHLRFGKAWMAEAAADTYEQALELRVALASGQFHLTPQMSLVALLGDTWLGLHHKLWEQTEQLEAALRSTENHGI